MKLTIHKGQTKFTLYKSEEAILLKAKELLGNVADHATADVAHEAKGAAGGIDHVLTLLRTAEKELATV